MPTDPTTEEDNHKRVCSAAEYDILNTDYNATTGEFWIDVVNKKYRRNRNNVKQLKKHTVCMKRCKKITGPSQVAIRHDRSRNVPIMINKGRRLRGAYRVRDKTTSLSHTRANKNDTDSSIRTFTAISCTCPDWTYRGVYSRQDRKKTETDWNTSRRNENVKVYVLRAFLGCKHMKCAEKKCSNGPPCDSNDNSDDDGDSECEQEDDDSS